MLNGMRRRSEERAHLEHGSLSDTDKRSADSLQDNGERYLTEFFTGAAGVNVRLTIVWRRNGWNGQTGTGYATLSAILESSNEAGPISPGPQPVSRSRLPEAGIPPSEQPSLSPVQ